MGGGHYTAYAINKDNQKWFNFDDNFVKEVEEEEQLVSPHAYLLFYKLRGIEGESILKGDAPKQTMNVNKLVGKLPSKPSHDELDRGGSPLGNVVSNCIIS